MEEQLELKFTPLPTKSRDIFRKRINFKPYEYPEILAFKDAISHAYWLVSEFNFTSDIQDFHTKLTLPQRSAIKNALLAISQIEVSVKKFWVKLGDRFPKAEFDQVGIVFGESEVRHADAYSHLLEVLGLNDDFTMLLENPVIQGRVDYLTKYLRGAADSSDENYTLIITLFSLFIENVSLFSQFAVIKSFNKHLNVLKDVDNVVQATQVEECHAEGTEILTPAGWVDLGTIEVGDEVYQYNLGKIESTIVQHKTHRYYSGDMVRFYNSTLECLVTPGHDMIYYNSANQELKKKAIDFKPHSKILIPRSGILSSGSIDVLTPIDKLRIAIQADGTHLKWTKVSGEVVNRGSNGGYNYQISLTKDRKKARLNEILLETGIEFITSHQGNKGEISYKLKLDSLYDYKEFNWINLSDKSSKWCKAFIEEVIEWDGFKTKSCKGYCSTNINAISIVQAIAVLAGFETNIPQSRLDIRKDSYKQCQKVVFKNRNSKVASHGLKKEIIQYAGEVNCVTVPSGVIITKYKGKVTIAGNCIHGLLGAKIVSYIREENPEWFNADFYEKIERAARKAFTAECEIIDWIFENGELDFLTKDSLKEFIKQRFNQSVVMVGAEPLFEIDNDKLAPLKWFNEELIAEINTDFFNKRPVTYSKKMQSITANDLF